MPLDLALVILDILGVTVFAVSGALKAAEKRMDIFGMILLASATGIGGGTLRDLLLGLTPVFWVQAPWYLALTTGAAVFVFGVQKWMAKPHRWLVWADAFGLATFCVLGAQVALDAGATWVIAVVMGVMSACFGGIIRDVLAGEVPLILSREVYASAAAAGATALVIGDALGAPVEVSTVVGFLVALVARAAGICFGLSLPAPKPTDSSG